MKNKSPVHVKQKKSRTWSGTQAKLTEPERQEEYVRKAYP